MGFPSRVPQSFPSNGEDAVLAGSSLGSISLPSFKAISDHYFTSLRSAQGDLSYLESISTFTLANAIARLSELKILVIRKVKKVVVIGLHPDWAEEERLGAWGEKLGAFRREGKSRRTNALGEFGSRLWFRFVLPSPGFGQR